VSFVAYSPLGRGFLTGQIQRLDDLAADDWRRHNPRFAGAAFEQNLEVVRRLEAWASDRGVTPAQLALAWVLARGEQVLTIPGTRSTTRLDENAAAAEILLSEAELAELDRLAPAEAFVGTRYPEATMGLVDA
jgi:aryl-alcohol dehydrogenase-like predicted oxidoreductase